ncbi:DNA translocase FtsK 4TM domain-containing protein, partial [Rothia nasimurium]
MAPRKSASSKSAPRAAGSRSKTSSRRSTSAQGRSRKASSAPPQESNAFVRALVGAWQALAFTVGGAVRRMGELRTDIELHERRDGGALLVLAIGLLTAGVEWWGWRADPASLSWYEWPLHLWHIAVGGLFGQGSLLIPILCLIFAIRIFRHPLEVRANNRIAIGFTIMTVSASMMGAKVAGYPSFSSSFDKFWGGGGTVGVLIGTPASRIVGGVNVLEWLLIALVFLAGLLVATDTPLRQIWPKIMHIFGLMLGEKPHGSVADAGRPSRASRSQDEAETRVLEGDHDRSYLYEDAPAPAPRRRGGLLGWLGFGPRTESDRRLDRYEADEAYQTAVIDDGSEADPETARVEQVAPAPRRAAKTSNRPVEAFDVEAPRKQTRREKKAAAKAAKQQAQLFDQGLWESEDELSASYPDEDRSDAPAQRLDQARQAAADHGYSPEPVEADRDGFEPETVAPQPVSRPAAAPASA